MRTRLIPIALALPLALAACGQRADLTPPPGATLPPAPYGSEVQPTAEELLEPDVIAVPQRDAELRTKSEEREDDPFDLPPE
ncbi:hypothetical protein AAG612_05130 [Citromicrobium bathyomarinum]|uniref:LPS translocon maturation chaperone LptM n=1 Tax=Citromicrobium bathyomarinum TaxID=72174 RepID=UPI00315A38B7